MTEVFSKRGRLDIVRQILLVCQRPVGKTRILYSCNLSHGLLTKYHQYLTATGLLESVNGDRGEVLFVVSSKGKEFLREYARLTMILEGKEDNLASTDGTLNAPYRRVISGNKSAR